MTTLQKNQSMFSMRTNPLDSSRNRSVSGHNMTSHLKNMFHIPGFVQSGHTVLLDVIREAISWKVYKPSPKSRLVATWAPGNHHTLVDELLADMVANVEATFKVRIGSMFLNLYKDGSYHCPYHSDKYSGISGVFTISLGQTRDLLIKKNGKGNKAQKYTLQSGDLYYMSNALQSTHKHSIPKRTRCIGERISIVMFVK